MWEVPGVNNQTLLQLKLNLSCPVDRLTCSFHWKPAGNYKSGCFWPDHAWPKRHSIGVNFPEGEKKTSHKTWTHVSQRGISPRARRKLRWKVNNIRVVALNACSTAQHPRNIQTGVHMQWPFWSLVLCVSPANTALIRPPTEYTLNVTGWPAARCVKPGVYFFILLLSLLQQLLLNSVLPCLFNRHLALAVSD